MLGVWEPAPLEVYIQTVGNCDVARAVELVQREPAPLEVYIL